MHHRVDLPFSLSTDSTSGPVQEVAFDETPLGYRGAMTLAKVVERPNLVATIVK